MLDHDKKLPHQHDIIGIFITTLRLVVSAVNRISSFSM
jgi:hypothetical protein